MAGEDAMKYPVSVDADHIRRRYGTGERPVTSRRSPIKAVIRAGCAGTISAAIAIRLIVLGYQAT
jgi:hypothetical protein